MRFEFQDQEYEIMFSRDLKKVEVTDYETNVKSEEWSKYPSTTVLILKVDNSKKSQFWDVIAQAEVACYSKDRFSPEVGRVYALRKLSGKKVKGRVIKRPLIDENMIAPMWEAYNKRSKGPSLREQNTVLRKSNEILLKLNEKVSEQLADYQTRYMTLLRESANEGMAI